MNPTGPGNYDLPSSFGSKVVEANKKNVPSVRIKERTEIPNIRDFASVRKKDIKLKLILFLVLLRQTVTRVCL